MEGGVSWTAEIDNMSPDSTQYVSPLQGYVIVLIGTQGDGKARLAFALGWYISAPSGPRDERDDQRQGYGRRWGRILDSGDRGRRGLSNGKWPGRRGAACVGFRLSGWPGLSEPEPLAVAISWPCSYFHR